MKQKTVDQLRFCSNLVIAPQTSDLQRPCGNVASVLLYLCADCWADLVARRIPAPLSLLTSREREVVVEILAGKVRKEMCEDLHLSPSGLRYHLRNVFRKFGVDRQQDLILFLQGGLSRESRKEGSV